MDPSTNQGFGRNLIPLEQCGQPVEIRQPNIDIQDISTINNPMIDQIPPQPADGAAQPKGFQFSVDAQEFVPKSSYFTPADTRETHQTYQAVHYEEEQYQEMNNADPILDYALQILTDITYSPGQYEKLSHQLITTLQSWPIEEDVIHELIEATINQAVWEPNFRYNGARLCNILACKVVTNSQHSSFRSILFNRCKDIHEERKNLMQSEAEYLRGFALFLSELYVHMTQKETNQRFSVLRTGVRDLIQTLLDHPTPGNVKCLCQILKLTGSFMEDDDRIQHGLAVDMNQLMANINSVVESAIPSQLKDLLRSVIDLRASDWGRAPKAPQVSNAIPTAMGAMGVYYGTDGLALTAEERQFLNEELGTRPDEDEDYEYPDDEGMDDEMSAAFEKFLMMNEGRK